MNLRITSAPTCPQCGSTGFRVFDDMLWEAEADLDMLDCTNQHAGDDSAIYCATCGTACTQMRFTQMTVR